MSRFRGLLSQDGCCKRTRPSLAGTPRCQTSGDQTQRRRAVSRTGAFSGPGSHQWPFDYSCAPQIWQDQSRLAASVGENRAAQGTRSADRFPSRSVAAHAEELAGALCPATRDCLVITPVSSIAAGGRESRNPQRHRTCHHFEGIFRRSARAHGPPGCPFVNPLRTPDGQLPPR